MKNNSRSITYIICGILMVLTSVFSFGLFTLGSTGTSKADISELPDWTPLVAGVYSGSYDDSVVHVEADSSENPGYNYTDNTYNYTANRVFINRDSISNDYSTKEQTHSDYFTPYDNNSYVLLRNYTAQQNLQYDKTHSYGIDTFYVGIGHRFGTNQGTDKYVPSLSKPVVYLSNTYVNNRYSGGAYSTYDARYGIRIATNAQVQETIHTGKNLAEEEQNYYWFQYFDLTDVHAIFNDTGSLNEVIPVTEGKYTIMFTMHYATYNEETNTTYESNDITCEYTFYLFGDSSYVEYPVFNAYANYDAETPANNKLITEYNKGEDAARATEYYNYQNDKLPTLLYDATKYNVAYSHTHNLTYNYTTSFSVEAGNGVLRTFRNGLLSNTFTMELVTEDGKNKVKYYNNDDELFATLTLNVESPGAAEGLHKLEFVANARQNELYIRGAKSAPLSYYYFMQFDELGNYEFNFSYVLGISNTNYMVVPSDAFVAKNILQDLIINTTEIAGTKNILPTGTHNYTDGRDIVLFGNTIRQITTEDATVGSDTSMDGTIILRQFGVTSYFYKTSGALATPYKMEDYANGIAADQTEYVKAKYGNGLYVPAATHEYVNVPSTNLQPVYFDYWGTYVMSDSVPTSKIYKVARGSYTKVGNKYTINDGYTFDGSNIFNYTKDTPLPIANTGYVDGLYIVVVQYTYDSYKEQNAQHSQVFVVELNNTAPALTVSANDGENTYLLTGVNSYTNKQYISATWQDPNYFQGDIYVTVDYYAYTTVGISDTKEVIYSDANPYQKGTNINVRNNMSREGKYEITLHYGLNSAITRTEVVYIDRSNTSFRLWEIGINGDTGDYEVVPDNMNYNRSSGYSIIPADVMKTIYSYSDTANNLIGLLNKQFMIGHKAKPSGAQVSITYTMIPFTIDANYDNEVGHILESANGNGVINQMFVNPNDSIVGSVSTYNYTIGDELGDTVDRSLVFGNLDENGSNSIYIYKVTISDEAGNNKDYFFIYDTSTPQFALKGRINGPDLPEEEFVVDSTRLVNTDTTMYFGDYKIIRINSTENQSVKQLLGNLQTQMAGSTTIWSGAKIINTGDTENPNYTYLFVPLANSSAKATLTKGKEITSPVASASARSGATTQAEILKDKNASLSSTTWTYTGTFTMGEEAYWLTVKDTLGNSGFNKIEMNLDKAQLLFRVLFPTVRIQEHDVTANPDISIVSVNGETYNTNEVKLRYKKNVTVGVSDTAQDVGVQVSYSYYPFSFESYLASNEYPTYSTTDPDAEEFDRPIPNYPFSRLSNKDYTYNNDNDLEQISGTEAYLTKDMVNGVAGSTAQGLYVVKRIYTGIDKEQFLATGEEDDRFVRYYMIYVDRYGIISLVNQFDPETSSTTVDRVSSVGNLIQMLLGADLGEGSEEYITTISSDIIVSLLDNMSATANIDKSMLPSKSTNKVKVELDSTTDKWSTTEKILDDTLTDYTIEGLRALGEVESGSNTLKSQTRNTGLFGLSIDLTRVSVQNNRTVTDVLVNNNSVASDAISNIRKILLTKQGTYSFNITDKSGYTFSEGGVLYRVGYQTKEIPFIIEYERPNGSFNTVYEGDELIDFDKNDTSTPVKFVSTNEKILEFNYSDPVDYTKADIDTSYILIESKPGSTTEGGVWSTILLMDGENIVNPRGVDLNAIRRNIEIGTTGKYKHIITIFDHDSANNLADSQADASYRVTLRYRGKESYYTVVDDNQSISFYTNSFVIYVDHRNPEYNLNVLKETDKLYNGEALTEYYFAINNGANATIFTSVDDTDSKEIYLRHLGSSYPTNYLRSVVNDEVSPGPQYPIFSIFNTELYTQYSYNNDKQFSFGDIWGENTSTAMPSGYYEVIERDEAGNCTVYIIFVSNNDNRNMALKYQYMHDGTTNSTTAYVSPGNETSYNIKDLNGFGYAISEETMSEDTSLLDQYAKVTIKSNGSVLRTLTNTPSGSLLPVVADDEVDWVNDVTAAVKTLATDNPNITEYQLTFTNRFGEDYVMTIVFPGSELELTIVTDNSEKVIRVTVPAKSNGVNLNEFNAYIWRNNTWDIVSTAANGVIDTYNENRTAAVTYIFPAGQYQFETVDNFGRIRTYNAYVGDSSSSAYTFYYGPRYYTNEEGVIYTSSNVTLDIDLNLWDVKVTPSSKTYYSVSTNAITKRSYYIFDQQRDYIVSIRWTTSSDKSYTNYKFVVDRTKPTATFTDVNGKIFTPGEDGTSTFTRNFYITYEQGDYGVEATIKVNGITYNMESGYFVNTPGSYVVTLTSGNGAEKVYSFVREDNTFTYYSVKIAASGTEPERLLSKSEYTSARDNRSVHNYYILDTLKERVELVVDSNEGYNYTKIEETATYDVYAIFKVDTNVICYVQINFVEESTNFANFLVYRGNETSGRIPQSNQEFVTYDDLGQRYESVTITTYSYNFFEGNTITISYYYNNQFVRTLYNVSDDKITFTFTRAGLHSFVVEDMAGNTQKFGLSNVLDIYLLNDVIFTVNGEQAINNRIYNETVTINLITVLKEPIYTGGVTVTATRNGQEHSPVVIGNNYRFTQSGYYTVTLSAIIRGVRHNTVYKFMITYNDVAHLSLSIPASYGFTITKVYLNEADITNRFTDKTSMWLSIADTGKGLFTIYATYWEQDSQTNKPFSFSIWINEDTPTIIPVDYTYGTKTSGTVVLQFNLALIYQQIGSAKVVLKRDGEITYSANATSSSTDSISSVSISGTRQAAGTYYIQVYDDFDRLIVSYKIIKTVPLNSSAKIIIFIASGVLVAGVVVFIILRRHTKFK